MWLVAERALAFDKRIVREFLERNVMTFRARLLDRRRFEQKLGARCMRLVAAQAALFERLEGRGQVWMTATEAPLFEGIGEASRFHVRPGSIART